MPRISRRGPALAIVSGLAAGSMLLSTGQTVAMPTHAPERSMASVQELTRKGEPPRPADATPDHSKDRAHHGTYTVKRGDTLWGISEHHYGDGSKWWALYGANGKAIEKKARAHGYKGSDVGHWIFPKAGLAMPDPDVMEANHQALEEALRLILNRHPALIGSPLCPEVHEGDDIGPCLLRLRALSPLFGRLDLLRRVASGVYLRLAEPFILCVLQGNDPVACPAGAILNPPAQG